MRTQNAKAGRPKTREIGELPTGSHLPPLEQIIPQRRRKLRVIAFDPGETTGVCFMRGPSLIDARQLETKDFKEAACIEQVNYYISKFHDADVIVYEDYRVYAWESEKHKWNSLHTPKLIGVIVCLAHMKGIPVVTRMAIDAKKFVTDDKLEEWGLRVKGKRHSNDAIRHAVYELIFGGTQLPKNLVD